MAANRSAIRRRNGSRCFALAISLVALSLMSASSAPKLSDEVLAERRERLAQMSATAKQQLRVKQERFNKLDPAERDRLRALYTAIEEHPRRQELRRLMTRYGAWLRELTPEDRSKLLATEPSQRVSLVRQLNEKLYKRYLAEAGKGMKPEDVKKLRDWMDDYADRHVADAAEQMSESERHYFEQAVLANRVDQVRMTVWGMILWRGKMPMPSDEDFRRLIAVLSPDEVRLYEMVKNNKDQRDELLRHWTRAAAAADFFGSRGRGPQPTQEDLSKLLASLPEDQRQKLMKLSPNRMHDELKRMWRDRRPRNRGDGKPGDPTTSERGPGPRGPDDRRPGDRGPGDRGPDGGGSGEFKPGEFRPPPRSDRGPPGEPRPERPPSPRANDAPPRK